MWVSLAAGIVAGAVLGGMAVQIVLMRRQLAYRELLLHSPLACALVAADDRLADANPLACRYLATAKGEPLPEPALRLLIGQARQSQQAQRSRLILKEALQERTVNVLAMPLEAGLVALYLEDCSAILQLMHQRDRWVGDAAHELKTPLTSIRLVAETVLARVPPEQQRWLERLLGEVQRLNLLVQDMLDFSQWQAGGERLEYQKDVDLVELIRQTWTTLEPLAERRRVQLALESPASLQLCADEQRLYRALLNLLDNAVRYSPSGKTFWVRVHPEPTSVFIEIIDCGPGFPSQDLDRVFERFYRADPARARQTGGTGLGLAIVRQIIEAHQGSISAANHPQTGGAWLKVRLPLSP